VVKKKTKRKQKKKHSQTKKARKKTAVKKKSKTHSKKKQTKKVKSKFSPAQLQKKFLPEKAGRATEEEVRETALLLDRMKKEVGLAFFGHEEVIDSLVRALICNGHVLLEGVPGIAKTLVIKSLAKVSGCSSKRIQFTVDLLPTDITGLTTYDPKKGFEVVKGPIFSNFIIADEINRSPPKTQSALLEAMQEKQVSIGKETHQLPTPFFVMASQNPLETEGVYSLPEAQVDRFLFKVIFSYPTAEHEARVMEENTTFKKFDDIELKEIVSPEKIIEMQRLVHKIYLDEKIKKYILDIIHMTRNKNFKYGSYIELGGSPRASINMYIGSKAQALLKGRKFVIPSDVKKVAYDVLRHRIILSYRAQAEDITPEKIIDEILRTIPSP
jgi:MoxR-like ATPase